MITSKRTLRAIERAEQLEKELAAAKRLVREAERDDNRKAREQARRDENRKKILVGAFVITHFNVASIVEKMEQVGFLKSDKDRALFNLEPLTKEGVSKSVRQSSGSDVVSGS